MASFFETITHVAETDIFSKTLNNQKKKKALQINEGLRNDHQILSNFFSSLSGVSATHSLVLKTFIRAAHALQIYTHASHNNGGAECGDVTVEQRRRI